MKKLFTLAMLALIATMTISAQSYRKWDFTNWSVATIGNLQAEATKGVTGGAWSDIEKANGDNATNGNCFWSYSNDNCVGGTLTANGVTIAETDGLVFNTSYVNRRSLAIAVNYPSTSLGNYAGGQYLWLGGGNAKSASARLLCFTIPKVKVGQKITIVAESHKPSDARGVTLFVNSVTDDANQIGESFKPTTLDTHTWEDWSLPAGIEPQEEVDILVYNTNGCHIYSIEVGNADQKSKVAYLYASEADAALTVAQANENYQVDAIDVTATTVTADQLQGYDATVVAANIPADNAAVSVLKEAQPWTPVVNLNPNLYPAWGYGEAVSTDMPIIEPVNASHKLFRDATLQESDGISFFMMNNGTAVTGLTLADKFADDEVVATGIQNSETVTIHTHNISHNGYIYIPFNGVDVTDDAKTILSNAIQMAAQSKSKITATAQPVIKLTYKNMKTLATITCANDKSDIYYTIDGTTPTEQSTLYTEPIEISAEGVTVKAAAIAEGYTLSEVSSQAVDLRQQMATPAISIAQNAGSAIVTLSSDQADATIYYNYDGSEEVNKSSVYTAPVTISMVGRTIYAFAAAEGFVNSELASQAVSIDNPKVRIDVLSHMDANSAEYNGGSTSTAYYFSWGKNKSGENGYNYYNPEVYTEETIVDPETGDEKIVKTYTEMNPEESKDFENGWMVRSRGQLTIWENQTTGTNYGDTGGYNFATVDDNSPYFPATKAYVNLADKNTIPADATFPYNAYIVTTQKFKGPFDIVANLASITKPESPGKHGIVLQVATDGNVWESNWQTVGDTINIEESARLTHNIARSYEGTDEVYVRAYLCANNSKVGFYDIYIANEGEKSQELITGITEQMAGTDRTVKTVYNLNGIRQSDLQRGLNIVVMSDGSVRKIMK